MDVSLPDQVIRRENGESIPFNIDPFRKHCLLNGLDDIGLTMQKVDKIEQFEKARAQTQPWLDNASQPFVVRNGQLV